MTRTLIGAVAMAALAAAFLAVVGCDDSDLDGAEFRIEPQEAVLTENNQTLVLTVVGGKEPFEWSVSDAQLGSVTSTARTVTYTRSGAKTGANSIRVTDDRQWTASALVRQEENNISGLKITPATATLSAVYDQAVFTATGGNPPYSWSVGVWWRGDLEPSGPNQVIYTRRDVGDNTVILTDGMGHVALAQLTQPAVTALAISPATASVAAINGAQAFTATGGNGFYTWSVVAPASGTLSDGTGPSTVYTSIDADPDILTVTDGSTTAFVTITKL